MIFRGGEIIGKPFTFEQQECLRLLKDYAATFAMDEIFAHECNKHNDKKACEMHEFTSRKMDAIKESAEHCGWTPTLTILTGRPNGQWKDE